MAKKKPEYTEKDLIAAIKDMNKVLNCDPALDLDDDMEMDDLIVSFKEGAEMAAEGDKFAKATVALAGMLKVSLGEADGEKEEKEDKKKAPADKKTDKKDTKKDTKKAPAKEKKAPAKKDKTSKYKRVNAFCDVLKKMPKKGLSIKEITEKTIVICEKNGLKTSAKFESVGWVLDHYMSPLVGMDVVTFDEKKETYHLNS